VLTSGNVSKPQTISNSELESGVGDKMICLATVQANSSINTQ